MLHPRLASETTLLGRLAISRVLLVNDSRYPWFVLVPERSGIREIFELNEADQISLYKEMMLLSRSVSDSFRAGKMNVATLGNIVPQLHVHIIARYEHDPAWPAPVWGIGAPIPYEPSGLQRMRAFAESLPGLVPLS